MATVTISLPDTIAKKVDAETRRHGFATRSEFIRSLLRRYFAGDEVQFEQFQPLSLDEVKIELARSGKYTQTFIESVTKGLAKSSRYAR